MPKRPATRAGGRKAAVKAEKRVELTVGLGGEFGVDLVMEEAGARFEHFEILIEIVKARR